MKITKIILGLETHIELKTDSKMFCGCPADHFDKPPNTQTCPVCLGLPGALPVPNKRAIDFTLMFGLSVGGQVNKDSYFERKNYFYPDLPKGYQISQKAQPFIIGGSLPLSDGTKVVIREAHLEEDTAKLQHVTLPDGNWSLIDFNRSGVPLLEIVTEPCLHSAISAKEYLEKLRGLVRWIGIADADMEKGSMRCEPNVNLAIEDNGKLYYTPIVEVKNINSFNFVKKAVDYEVQRQFEEFILTKQEKVKGNKQTRGWNEAKGFTVLQRTKEEADDYRYFPEPDIPPFRFTGTEILKIKNKIVKMGTPWEAEKMLLDKYDLSNYQASLISQERETVAYFEEVMGEVSESGGLGGFGGKGVANTIINKKINISVQPKDFVQQLQKVAQKTTIDERTLKETVKEILKEHNDILISYQKGREQVLGVVVGMVKQRTGAIIDFQTLKNIIDQQ